MFRYLLREENIMTLNIISILLTEKRIMFTGGIICYCLSFSIGNFSLICYTIRFVRV